LNKLRTSDKTAHTEKDRKSSVGIGTWLWSRRPSNRNSILGSSRDTCLVHSVQVGLGSHRIYSMGTQVLFPVKQTTQSNLLQMLRIRYPTPPLRTFSRRFHGTGKTDFTYLQIQILELGQKTRGETFYLLYLIKRCTVKKHKEANS
jgi:hypothetical protein